MVKPKIRITTKELLCKQVIVPMNKSNGKVIMKQANFLIDNINKCLKDTKSKNFANFIYLEDNRVVITIS